VLAPVLHIEGAEAIDPNFEFSEVLLKRDFALSAPFGAGVCAETPRDFATDVALTRRSGNHRDCNVTRLHAAYAGRRRSWPNLFHYPSGIASVGSLFKSGWTTISLITRAIAGYRWNRGLHKNLRSGQANGVPW
jgi:hypothetical protein